MLDVGCWILDAGCWISHAGRRTLDAASRVCYVERRIFAYVTSRVDHTMLGAGCGWRHALHCSAKHMILPLSMSIFARRRDGRERQGALTHARTYAPLRSEPRRAARWRAALLASCGWRGTVRRGSRCFDVGPLRCAGYGLPEAVCTRPGGSLVLGREEWANGGVEDRRSGGSVRYAAMLSERLVTCSFQSLRSGYAILSQKVRIVRTQAGTEAE